MRRESSRGPGLPAGLAGPYWERTGRSGSALAPPGCSNKAPPGRAPPSRRRVVEEDGVS
jgi:hypothetical protein